MKSKHLFRQLNAAVLCLALGPAGSVFAQENPPGREISIVVEEGDKVPARVLDMLAAQELASGTTAEVTFSIIEGYARLTNVDGQTVNGASGGAVAHPDIIAGPHYDESYVQMLADGKPFGRPLRIGTIASGSLGELLAKDVPAGSEALLAGEPNYAVVDIGLLRSKTATDSKQAPTGQYCADIVSKERDIYGYSRVLAQGCSDQSEEEAFARAQSKASLSGYGILYSTFLMSWFEHYGYGGRYKSIYGCCGTCDFAGYTLTKGDGTWPRIMSSARGNASGCNTTRYTKWIWFPGYETGWGPARALPDGYVGDYYNDSIGSVKVYRWAV
jgi:hypothetical protein